MGRRRKRLSVDDILGSLEARIMEDLWKNGRSTVGDVLERLNAKGRKELAYNTVMSVMARLETKGLLERERDGRAFAYWPASSREDFFREHARQIASELLEDFGERALAGIVDSVGDHSDLARERPDLMKELERIINEGDS